MSEIMNNIGNWIMKTRKHKGYTQRGLAEKAGISAQCLCSIERGKRSPDMATLLLILGAMGYTLELAEADDEE